MDKRNELRRTAAWMKSRQERENSIRAERQPELQRVIDFVAAHQPQWETLEGQDILRIRDQPEAGIPSTGKRTSRGFVMFNIETREELCYIRTRSEAEAWLVRMARVRAGI